MTTDANWRAKVMWPDLQKAVCKPSALNEPFIYEADGWGKQQTAAHTIEQALGHDDLQWL